MEQKKSISIFSAVALFLYISAIVFFCISLISEYKTAERHVEDRFKKLAKSTADSYSADMKNSATFTNSMLQLVNSTGDIASVYVLNEGETIFEWPQSSAAENTSPLIKSCSTVIAQSAAGNVTLTASLYVLKPESIYKTAKISFIVVLAATLCTVVFFVYINITGSIPAEKPFVDIPKFRPSATKKRDDGSSLPDDKTGFSDLATFSSVATLPPFPSAESESAPLNEEKNDEMQISEPVDEQPDAALEGTCEPVSIINDPESVERTFSNPPRMDDTYTLTSETISPARAEEPYTLDTETMTPAENPESQLQNSKYSPFTGFCWESYIDAVLEAELQASEAEGKDVSLMLLRISGLDRMDYVSESIRGVLYHANGSRDLLFEYKNDGYAILLPQTDINGGIKIAEMIEPEVTAILQAQNLANQLMIGISARTQRIVSADVLHTEAEKALAHAEPSLPLIAFRVDPEKYREFMEQTQG